MFQQGLNGVNLQNLQRRRRGDHPAKVLPVRLDDPAEGFRQRVGLLGTVDGSDEFGGVAKGGVGGVHDDCLVWFVMLLMLCRLIDIIRECKK